MKSMIARSISVSTETAGVPVCFDEDSEYLSEVACAVHKDTSR